MKNKYKLLRIHPNSKFSPLKCRPYKVPPSLAPFPPPLTSYGGP